MTTTITMIDHETIVGGLRAKHDARVTDLLHANNRYQEEGRNARKELAYLKQRLLNCEPEAADLALTILGEHEPDEQVRKNMLPVLSDRIQTVVKDLVNGN